MENPRVRVTYAVCCACRQCRKETGHNLVVLDIFDTEEEALKDLDRYLNQHTGHCFLAQQKLREIPPQPSNRKAA